MLEQPAGKAVTGGALIWRTNYHTDGGQLFCPLRVSRVLPCHGTISGLRLAAGEAK